MLCQVSLTEAATLQLRAVGGRITIRAEGVELGQILKALRQRTGIRVVIDEQWMTQRVNVALEAQGAEEAVWKLLRQTGGTNYVIVYSQDRREFEAVRLAEGGTSTASPQVQSSSSLPDSREHRRENGRLASSGQARPSQAMAIPAQLNPQEMRAKFSLAEEAASIEPEYIPAISEPAYLAPVSALVQFPEIVPPVYVPPLKDPEYVPEVLLPSPTKAQR